MRRKGSQLTLSTEHRAAASQDHIALQLQATGDALALSVLSEAAGSAGSAAGPSADSPRQRVLDALAPLDAPASVQHLRPLCRIRTATLCAAWPN